MVAAVTMHFIWHSLDLFLIVVTIFPLNLWIFGQIINKKKYFFDIQDGGDYHFEFWSLDLFDSMLVFYIKVAISLPNFVLD